MKKAIRVYVLVTQFIITLVLGGLLGAYLGERFGDPKTGASLFAGIGLIIALAINLLFIFQFLKNEKRHSDDEDK